jgi:hypothetical protein
MSYGGCRSKFDVSAYIEKMRSPVIYEGDTD